MSEAQVWSDVRAPKWVPSRTAWLLTCVDLTSLLLGFFVLMFSTQTMDRNAWQAVNGSFQSRFADKITVMPVVPDGSANALVVVPGVRSGLGYLDSLLHQRLAADAVWGGVMADVRGEATEMSYSVPMAARKADESAVAAAWRRLADAVRGWKNPLLVRVVVASEADWEDAARQAWDLAAHLRAAGVMNVAADVARGSNPDVQLVVLAR